MLIGVKDEAGNTCGSRKMLTFVRILTKPAQMNHEATEECKKAREMLTAYLSQYRLRKTPERYAILDTVYGMKGHFTLDELSEELAKNSFPVARATLYNTMRLFIEMRLVVRHRFIGQTKYEACITSGGHLHQVCTVCGRVTEAEAPHVAQAISQTRLHRFHCDGFTLYLYGVCSACQQKIAKQRKKNIKNKTQDKQ